jgi:hypothetical protein
VTPLRGRNWAMGEIVAGAAIAAAGLYLLGGWPAVMIPAGAVVVVMGWLELEP